MALIPKTFYLDIGANTVYYKLVVSCQLLVIGKGC